MLAKVPASVQHAALALIAALLTWAATDLDSFGLPLGVKAVVAALLTWAVGYLAPVVNGYGVGKPEAE